MAFKARDGLPKVQLDKMTKSQLVATVKKLQKRETALLNQVAKLEAQLAQALKPDNPLYRPTPQADELKPVEYLCRSFPWEQS